MWQGDMPPKELIEMEVLLHRLSRWAAVIDARRAEGVRPNGDPPAESLPRLWQDEQANTHYVAGCTAASGSLRAQAVHLGEARNCGTCRPDGSLSDEERRVLAPGSSVFAPVPAGLPGHGRRRP